MVKQQQQNLKTLSKKQTAKHHLLSFPENFCPSIIILPLFRELSRLEVSGSSHPTSGSLLDHNSAFSNSLSPSYRNSASDQAQL